jgi:2-methylcitrate dehydratase PrpD
LSTSIEDRMAEFVTRTKLEDIPKETVEFVKGLALKQAAGILAGSRMPAGMMMTTWLKEREKAGGVAVIGCETKTSLWDSVLSHGMFAHASELEDDRFGGGVSWDITVFPVAFSLACKNHLSGREFLESSIVGLEIHCRTCLFSSEHRGLLVIPGAIGPACAATKALKLGLNETMFAMGLAMSSSTLTTSNYGTEAHYFESAMQSLHAVIAAEMASIGMRGNPDIGAYLTLLLGNEKVNPPEMTQDLGSKWRLHEIWIKKYPCCFGTHRQIDMLLELMSEYNLSYDHIEEVEAHVNAAEDMLDRPEPKVLGDLQFSLQHTLATAMINSDVTLSDIAIERIADPHLGEARRKVKVVLHPEWPSGIMEAPVTLVLKLKDGRQFSKTRQYAIGSPAEPLAKLQFKALYRKFTQGILPDADIANTADKILDIENLADVNEVFEVLSASHPS